MCLSKALAFAAVATALTWQSSFGFSLMDVPPVAFSTPCRSRRTPQWSSLVQRASRLSIRIGASSEAASSSTATAGAKSGTVKLEGRTIQGSVEPLNNFVLVRLAAAQEKTEGGILLTGKAKVVKTEGTVVAIGPGRIHPDSGIVVPVPVQVGEGVVYGKYDGTEVDYDGGKHTLIRDDDVLVKFRGDSLTLEGADVIRDNVLVRVDTSEQTTEGGILIAKTSAAEKRPSTGEVVKVGPGRVASNGDIMPMEVAPGDMVKFRDFASNEVEIEGQEYNVVRMVDILAKY